MSNNWFTWALLSAVAAALTAVLTKIGATGVSANMATAVRTVVVLVFAWGLVFVGGDTAEFSKLSRRNLVFWPYPVLPRGYLGSPTCGRFNLARQAK